MSNKDTGIHFLEIKQERNRTEPSDQTAPLVRKARPHPRDVRTSAQRLLTADTDSFNFYLFEKCYLRMPA